MSSTPGATGLHVLALGDFTTRAADVAITILLDALVAVEVADVQRAGAFTFVEIAKLVAHFAVLVAEVLFAVLNACERPRLRCRNLAGLLLPCEAGCWLAHALHVKTC